ncbi:MAG: PspC domain-containing protein [Solirubrobacteraceae bacterium]|nr:PspC domain-containing protein [Solirubrobacteraceae bacterium]
MNEHAFAPAAAALVTLVTVLMAATGAIAVDPAGFAGMLLLLVGLAALAWGRGAEGVVAVSPAGVTPGRTVGARPRASRSDDDRVVAGVCSGLGRWLDIDPPALRLAFVGASAIGGVGLLAYVGLAVGLPAPATGTAPPAHARPLLRRWAIGGGFAFMLAGAAALLSAVGLAPAPGVVTVATLGAVGAGLLWRAVVARLDERETPRTSVTSGVRILVGLVLLAAGALLSLRPDGVSSLGVGVVVAAIVSTAAALAFGPSLLRARRDADAERLERIRADERATVAARLHDSVLQTFALLQRLDDASPRVQSLARSQERELRAWLYGGEDPEGPQTLASALRKAVEEVEGLHGVPVDLVQPTDAPLDDDSTALVQAAREAMVNAARHSGADRISVLARVTPAALELYVRDRGAGFDLEAVPDDRRGVRSSIIERVQRHGGTAAITTSPGAGTEVELRLPRHPGGSGA